MMLTLSILLAIANAILQLIDLHTTSETIKRGLGHEANTNLADLMNGHEAHEKKFWRLLWIKTACIAAGALMPAIVWWLQPLGQSAASEAEAIAGVILAQAVLVVYYARVMMGNWRVYKGG